MNYESRTFAECKKEHGNEYSNKYKGKLFSLLGDSISTLKGYSEPEDAEFYEGMRKFEANVFLPEDTWWGMTVDALGGKMLVNNSFSGSTVCKKRGYMIPSYASSDERTSSLSRDDISPDVIMIYMGTNDWGSAIAPLPEDAADESSPVFSLSYRSMLSKIKRNYPNAEIWCFTLGVSTYKNDESFSFPYKYAGRHIEEYCSVIRSCAKEYGCRIIDLYAETSTLPFNSFDRFHPNDEGMKRISDAVISALGKSYATAP